MRRDAYLDRIEHIAAKTIPITHRAQAVLPPLSLSDSPIPEQRQPLERGCLPVTLYTNRPADSCTGMHLGYNTAGYIVSLT